MCTYGIYDFVCFGRLGVGCRDYVDRGKRSLETICLLMCYKVKYPQNFFIMRGNHESASINKMYVFYDVCEFDSRLYGTFLGNSLFVF